MTKELEERYILQWAEMTGMTSYTLITEYFIDGEWRIVHTEWALEGIKDILDNECEMIESDYTDMLKKVIYKPKKTSDGIWFRNRIDGMTGEIPQSISETMRHFTNVSSKYDKYEPIFNRLSEAHFFVDEMGEIVEKPELTEFLHRIEEDVMYFNFNWIPEEKHPIPLKTLLELMDKTINVEIVFHDVEGVVIYKIKLENFRFVKIYNLRHYDWGDSGIKELPVEYTFEKEQIII